MRAPPRLSSSRLTLVMTACFNPSVATASATRRGSSRSSGCGRPLGTAQKPQRRVQMSPSNIKVAVRWFQHSPMFGHCADSQTVCRPRPRASFFKLWKFSPTGALARSHSGFGCRTGGPRSIWTNWDVLDTYSFYNYGRGHPVQARKLGDVADAAEHFRVPRSSRAGYYSKSKNWLAASGGLRPPVAK